MRPAPPRRPFGDGGLRGVCRPLSDWKAFYAGLVRDPIRNAIYTAREYLDFRVACGDASLGRDLQRVLLDELGRADAFIPVLANDTIANLPPLTFYRDSIVESDGSLRQTLDIEKTALDPLVDAARVFAFAGREASTANTLRRLQLAADGAPHLASVLDDAAEGLRILVYHHALAGLAAQTDEAVVHPSRLNRYEQRLLKTAFDATRRFLELAYSAYNVGEPV